MLTRDKINLFLGGLAWVIFTLIGHTYALRIGSGFPTVADYLFFAFAVVMFVITWFVMLINLKQIKPAK